MKTGIELIAAERKEQIEKHGRTVQDDIKVNPYGELLMGVRALIMSDETLGYFENDEMENLFPENWDKSLCLKMMKKNLKERLIISGALIAAEIDRLQHS